MPHTYRADTSRVLLVATSSVRAPGRYEDFLRAVAEPAELTEDDEATLAVLTAPFGVEVLGGPGTLPAQP